MRAVRKPGATLRQTALGLLLSLGVACRPPEEPLPVIASVPDFSLVDQSGKTVTGSDLDGSVWVVAFLFTRCTSICPMLTQQMANFQRRLGPDAARVRFLAFSVDSEHDTPEVMARFARERGAPAGFTFLSGDAAEVHRVAVTGFRAAVGEPTVTGEGETDVIHTQHLMLLDGHRRMRGFYRTDAEGLERLEHDVARLVQPD